MRGASATLAGIALTAATLDLDGRRVGSGTARATRSARASFVRAGTLLIACGIAGMIVDAQFAVPIAVAVVAWGVGGLGMGLAYAPLSLIVLGEAPDGGEGAASAALQLSEHARHRARHRRVGRDRRGRATRSAGATRPALTIAFVMCGAGRAARGAAPAQRLPGALST